MQGTIVKLLVEVGDTVEAGAGIVVLEAMKMENEVKAEVDGVVGVIHKSPGETVEQGDVIVEIDVSEAADPSAS